MCTTLLLGLYLIFWFSCLCYLIPILVMYLLNIPPIVSAYTILNYVEHISKTVIVKILFHEKECEECWMMRLEDTSLRYRLKNAIFIVLENILASGYGLFIPEKNGHIIFNSILMIIGRFIVCYMLGKALYMQYLSIKNYVFAKYVNLVFQLCSFVSKLKEKRLNQSFKN